MILENIRAFFDKNVNRSIDGYCYWFCCNQIDFSLIGTCDFVDESRLNYNDLASVEVGV